MSVQSARSVYIRTKSTDARPSPPPGPSSARGSSQRRNTTMGKLESIPTTKVVGSLSPLRRQNSMNTAVKEEATRRHSVSATPLSSLTSGSSSAILPTTAWELKAQEIKAKKDRRNVDTREIIALVKKRNSSVSLGVSEVVQKPLMRLVTHVTPPRAFAAPTPPRSPVSMSLLSSEVGDGLVSTRKQFDNDKDKLRSVGSFRKDPPSGFEKRRGSSFLGDEFGDFHQQQLSRTGSHRGFDSGSDNERVGKAGSSSSSEHRLQHAVSWSKQYPTTAGRSPLVKVVQTPLSISNTIPDTKQYDDDVPEIMLRVNSNSGILHPTSSSLKRTNSGSGGGASTRKVASFHLGSNSAGEDPLLAIPPTGGNQDCTASSIHQQQTDPTTKRTSSHRRTSQSRRSVIAARNVKEEDRMYNKHFDSIEKFQYVGIGQLHGIGGKVLDEYHAEMERMNQEEEKERHKADRNARYQTQLTQWNTNTANALPTTMLSGRRVGSGTDTEMLSMDTPEPVFWESPTTNGTMASNNSMSVVITSPPPSHHPPQDVLHLCDSSFGPMEESTMGRPVLTRRRSTKTVTMVNTSGSDSDGVPMAYVRRRSSGGTIADQLYGKKNSSGNLTRKTSGGCVDESYLSYQREQRKAEERRHLKKRKASLDAAASSTTAPPPTIKRSSSKTLPVFEDRKAMKAFRVIVRSLEGGEYIERVCLEDREKRDLKEIAVLYLAELQKVLDIERKQLITDREADRQDKRDSLLTMGFTNAEIDYRWSKELQPQVARREQELRRSSSITWPSPPGSARKLSSGANKSGGRATPATSPSAIRHRSRSDLSTTKQQPHKGPSRRTSSRSSSPPIIHHPFGVGSSQNSMSAVPSPIICEGKLVESGGESSDDNDEGVNEILAAFNAPNPFFDVYLTYEESTHNDAQALEETVLDEPCVFPVYIASGCGQHQNFKFVKEKLINSTGPNLPKRHSSNTVDEVVGSMRSSLSSNPIIRRKGSLEPKRGGSNSGSALSTKGSTLASNESLPKGSYLLVAFIQHPNGSLVPFDYIPIYTQLKLEHGIESLVSRQRSRRSLRLRPPSYRRISTTSGSRSPSPQPAALSPRHFGSLPPVPPSVMKRHHSSTRLSPHPVSPPLTSLSPPLSTPSRSKNSFSVINTATSPKGSRAGSFQRSSSPSMVPPPLHLTNAHLLTVTPQRGTGGGDAEECSPSSYLSNTLQALSPRSPTESRDGAFSQTQRAEVGEYDDDGGGGGSPPASWEVNNVKDVGAIIFSPQPPSGPKGK